MKNPRVLITNDDGIASPGLHQLAAAAHKDGLEVVIAAPMNEASGSGTAITAVESSGRVVVEERTVPGLPEVPAYAVAASPAFITLIATRGAFGDPPDLVLSGINRGANVGRAIMHSGTVGAALTASAYGRSAMAVSLDVGLDAVEPPNWQTAAEVARRLFALLAEAEPPMTLNLNVPDVPADRVPGLRSGALASFGAVQINLAEAGKGYLRVAIADSEAAREPGTDAAWLADGYASLTPLQPTCEMHRELPQLAGLWPGQP
ncbi:MAG TPA: 5'/3'-nucleotidase SurE [Micromonosporaceae bacterium]|nr:5'/3'-nucleotidase SurE [Micromonosporaceae bacterium]